MDLPSAQHRAGLAGLVLLVQWLGQRSNRAGICKITKLDQYGAIFEIDREGMRSLFNELFAASWQPREKEEGKRDAVPTGAFLAEFDPSGTEKNWLSLWQELVVRILRNKSRNRLPFVARAEGQETKEAENYWEKLIANSTEEISGTYLLGARAKNAELTPFLTTARLKFLLHFWPLVIWVNRLMRLGKDKTSYFIAIPDVFDLKLFCKTFPKLFRQQGTEKTGAKIPKASLVSVPAGVSLEALYVIDEISPLYSAHTSLRQAILGIEIYQAIRTKHDIVIQNFKRVTTEHTRRDCRNLYEQYLEDFYSMPTKKTSDENKIGEPTEKIPRKPPESIEEAVYEIVHTYLNRKVSIKENLVWDKIKEDKEKRKEYNEKKRKIALTAFYDVRSRTGEDFIEYFTAKLCSVSQFISEKGFLQIAYSLSQEPSKVRYLTLLALSAQA